MKQIPVCFLLLMVPGAAFASNWTQIPGMYANETAYVDMASVRQDTYPKKVTMVRGPIKNYLVAWISTRDQNGASTATLEVVFDCKGRYGLLQQLIANETKESRYHTFDSTAFFEAMGARTSSIMPDSFYDKAALMVCKDKFLPNE
jgi:hypothetical protein